MGWDFGHNSARARSHFERGKGHFARAWTEFCGEMFVSQIRKYCERTKINFAFKISIWMCADVLFRVCKVSLSCSFHTSRERSLSADGSLAQHNPALQYAIIPANQRWDCYILIGWLENQSQDSLHHLLRIQRTSAVESKVGSKFTDSNFPGQ